MPAKKKKKILITAMDGFNVHNPEKTKAGTGAKENWIEFSTLHQAENFAGVVQDYGWAKSKALLQTFQQILSSAGSAPRI